jgi:hypothetical protein
MASRVKIVEPPPPTVPVRPSANPCDDSAEHSGFCGFLWEAVSAWNNHDGQRLSAALAFYATLSLAPLLLLMVSLAALFFGSSAEDRIVAEIQILLGSEVGSAVKSVLFNSQKPAAEILSAVTGLVVFMVAPPASSAKFAQRSIGFGTFRRKLAPASSVLSKIASFPSVCCWPSAACSCFHCS